MYGHVACMGAVSARKPEWKRPLRRTGDRQKANIKMELIEIGLDGVD
jgi:hypothetical protein